MVFVNATDVIYLLFIYLTVSPQNNNTDIFNCHCFSEQQTLLL